MMFLQKYHYQLPQRNSLMLGFHSTNNRIEDATKRISTSQLKGHQNKPNYTDPRKFLIENTQKVIAEKQRTPREVRSSNRNYFEKEISVIVKKNPLKIMGCATFKGNIWPLPLLFRNPCLLLLVVPYILSLASPFLKTSEILVHVNIALVA